MNRHFNLGRSVLLRMGVLLLFGMVTSSVEARLGETKEQCAKRYWNGDSQKMVPFKMNGGAGSELPPEFVCESFDFNLDGRKGLIDLIENVCQRIVYSNIQEDEIPVLLSKNSEGKKWYPAKTPEAWERSDGGYAYFGKDLIGELFLVILSVDYIEKMTPENRQCYERNRSNKKALDQL